MKKLIIAIDFDDVLVESSRLLPALFNKKYNTNLRFEDMYCARYEAFGVTTQLEAIRRLHAVMETPEYIDIPPTKNAIEVVKRLAQNHELHVVTGRASFLEPYTHTTLEKYFPGCFASVEHTNHFHDGGTNTIRRTKSEVCQQLKANILIDDLPSHIDDVLQSGVSEVVLFGQYPWNKDITVEPAVRRCNDWSAVSREIERIVRE